jgi:hypothetical protein
MVLPNPPFISPCSLIPSTPILCSPFRAPNASSPSFDPLPLVPRYTGTRFHPSPGPQSPTPGSLRAPHSRRQFLTPG